MFYALSMGLKIAIAIPNNTPLPNQQTMMPISKKIKALLFQTPSTEQYQFPSLFQPKRKNGDMRKKRHAESKKQQEEKSSNKTN